MPTDAAPDRDPSSAEGEEFSRDLILPGIGKLPVIGALFSSNGFKRGQTELVIIVTPLIVGPTRAAAAPRCS